MRFSADFAIPVQTPALPAAAYKAPSFHNAVLVEARRLSAEVEPMARLGEIARLAWPIEGRIHVVAFSHIRILTASRQNLPPPMNGKWHRFVFVDHREMSPPAVIGVFHQTLGDPFGNKFI